MSKQNACTRGDITGELPLAQTTVSQHLKALKSAGIIKGEVEGVRTCYCLNEENLAEMKRLFEELLEKLSPQNSTCC